MTQFRRPCRLKIQITSTPSSRKDVLQIARSQFGPVQVVPGCLDIRLLQAIDKPDCLIWEEAWTSLELLERRVASASFRSVLALIDMSTGSPDITVSEIIHDNGMEWISTVREEANK